MLFMLSSMLDLCMLGPVHHDLFHIEFNIASAYILNNPKILL
jgi:hypothetical protein